MMGAVALDGAAPAAGAEDAVEALFRAEYRALVRLASLLLDDRGAAEEVVQDAFVKLHVAWAKLREPERAAAWLRSAVLNGARSRLRHRAVRRRHLTVARDRVEVDFLADVEQRRMIAALRTLPERQREALVLKFYADLSEAETAVAMGVSAGSVKTHVHRGLAALERLLEEDR